MSLAQATNSLEESGKSYQRQNVLEVQGEKREVGKEEWKERGCDWWRKKHRVKKPQHILGTISSLEK